MTQDCLVIINQLLEHYMGVLEAQIQNEVRRIARLTVAR